VNKLRHRPKNKEFPIDGPSRQLVSRLNSNSASAVEIAKERSDIIGSMSEVTELLAAVERGDSQATAELLPLVYDELRRLARGHMAQERAEHTLQATALVHDAYLRLVGDVSQRWDGRGHFFAAAAEAMRRILIEHARRKNALKRGGHRERIELNDELPPIASPCDNVDDLLALDEALDRLAAEDPDKAELVKLLYFAGLNLEEAATAQGISRTTAYRHWLFARAWLHDAITGKRATE
jgi:RNA polymerase sigma factor (TIGR02999 family)